MIQRHRLRGRNEFERYRIILVFISKVIACLPLRIRKRLLETFRYTTGKKGIGIRWCILKSIALECGDNVAIFPGVYLLNPEHLRIGNNVSIHPMSYIECGSNMGGYALEMMFPLLIV